MLVFVCITCVIIAIIVSVLVVIYKQRGLTQSIDVRTCRLQSSSQEVSKELVPSHSYLDLYIKSVIDVPIISGLVYDIYIELTNGARVSTTRQKSTTPIEFSDRWLYKRLDEFDTTNVESLIFDFVYVDLVYSHEEMYRVYMHDSDIYRMGEVIKFDFNKTKYWFDTVKGEWTQTHNSGNVFIANIMKSVVQLPCLNVERKDKKMYITCNIHEFILPFINKL